MTKQVDYALQLIFALNKVKKGDVLSLKKFSTESTISFLFLQKIAKLLREAGVITAVKGPLGGYVLLKSLDMLTLREIVDAVDGPFGVAACTRPGETCTQTHDCTVRPGIKKLQTQMMDILNRTKLTDLL